MSRSSLVIAATMTIFAAVSASVLFLFGSDGVSPKSPTVDCRVGVRAFDQEGSRTPETVDTYSEMAIGTSNALRFGIKTILHEWQPRRTTLDFHAPCPDRVERARWLADIHAFRTSDDDRIVFYTADESDPRGYRAHGDEPR
ncbi:hypothetical protein [Minwuia sp.]|uniref:hypothetical protein n=1 Tax=Minwuia sp. TaxID=2493630 RepID=UPI003A8E25B8